MSIPELTTFAFVTAFLVTTLLAIVLVQRSIMIHLPKDHYSSQERTSSFFVFMTSICFTYITVFAADSLTGWSTTAMLICLFTLQFRSAERSNSRWIVRRLKTLMLVLGVSLVIALGQISDAATPLFLFSSCAYFVQILRVLSRQHRDTFAITELMRNKLNHPDLSVVFTLLQATLDKKHAFLTGQTLSSDKPSKAG